MENHSPINIFIAYSSKDEHYLNELRVHLEPLVEYQIIDEIWFDGKIIPGAIWADVIKTQLDAANIILLLLSPDFLHSHYCRNEMIHALDRHEKQTATVIPIVIRPCSWKINPQLSRIEAAIKSRVISTAPHREELYVEITDNVVEVAQEKRKIQELARLQAQEQARLVQLQKEEATFWEKIASENTIAAYDQYLKKYPNGKYILKAKQSIQAIEAAQEQARLVQLQKEEATFWEKIASENTITAYDQYLKKYPNGKYSAEASSGKQVIQQKIREATSAKDNAFWQAVKQTNTKESYQTYLDQYPDGLHQSEAKAAIQRMTMLLPEMVFVAGGKDRHGNTIRDFWIGKYAVTNEEYAFFLNRYGSDTVQDGAYKGEKMVVADSWGVKQQNQQWQPAKGYERHPIVNVTWYGANAYCEWLKQETGEHYQLPDEWHWEWAARGGQKSKGYEYAGSNDIEEVAWYNKNSYDKGSTHPDYGTHRVGEKKANELGLYDMSGNVWEWCINEWEGNTGLRVVRGGSWYYSGDNCAVSYRSRYYSDLRYSSIGVRVSRY